MFGRIPRGSRAGRRKKRGRLLLFTLLLGLGGAILLAAYAARDTREQLFLLEEKNRTAVPTHYDPLTFAEFLALPSLPAEYGATGWQVVRAASARAVSLEGYIAEVRRMGDGLNYGLLPWDGDLHVHLRDRPQPRCFPEGPRGGQIVTEVTPPFQPPKTGWSWEALLGLCQRQARVRISGWLLYDTSHIDGVGRWRASAWEIHPITKIEVWDPRRRAWQPVS